GAKYTVARNPRWRSAPCEVAPQRVSIRAMLQLSSLAKSFGARSLFSDVTLKLNPGRRYGLVGANGAGKTTFLRMLIGDEPSSEGTITVPRGVRLGVLRQDLRVDDRQPIIEVCMSGDAEVFAALKEQEASSHADG